jgi:hypothetical protein
MVQRAKGVGFLFESGAPGRIAGQIGRQDFDGDQTVQAIVARPPNLAHPTLAELVDDLVIA